MEILVLQTCDPTDAGTAPCHNTTGQHWRQEAREGEPAELIVDDGARMEAELVVMTTRGRLGLIARMRGSRTDRVLRELHPAIAVDALRC